DDFLRILPTLDVFKIIFVLMGDHIHSEIKEGQVDKWDGKSSEEAHHYSHCRSYVYCEFYQVRKGLCIFSGEMFPCKNGHGLIKDKNVVDTAFFCAFPFVVNDSGFGKIEVFVTGLCYAVGEVYV